MKISIDISDILYDRIVNAKSIPDLMGIEIVNAINAIKHGTLLSDKEIKVKYDDAISRKQILAFIDGLVSDPDERKKGLDYIHYMPPVKPQEKTGHWIEHPHEAGQCWELSMYECSECHEWAEDDSDFCPNCGAKMIEPQERSDKE